MMLRYENEWHELPTELMSGNESAFRYQAIAKEFSYFAINASVRKQARNENSKAAEENITNATTEECLPEITYAMKGSECAAFSSSCVPEGWAVVGKCPVQPEVDYGISFAILISIIAALVYSLKKK